MTKALIIGIILLFICISITPSTGTIVEKKSIKPISNGNTLYVGGTGEGNYTSIQDAIDDASEGDTIRVYNGIYNETVEVNKRLNLIGNGSMGTIIDGGFPDHQHVVYITANAVNMSGFGVKNSYMGHEFGGIGVQSFNNRIFDNFCWNNLYGVILFGSNNRIYNNSFSYNKRNGIWVKSSGNIIYNNHCLNSSEKDGIWLYICTDNILSNNTCSHNYMNGIALYQSHNNYIFNNTCIDNKLYDGILIYESSNNEFSNNNLSYNNNDGIGISYFSDYNIFTNNIIMGNRIGVNIKGDCVFNTLHYNNIDSNYERGICLDSSSNNTIYHNNFIDNTQNAYDNCNNTWDNGYPSGGNYWDDYNGTDDDGDGIGDTPYPIPGGDNEDRYPLMNSGGNNPPSAPLIDGPTSGDPGIEYNYTFVSTDPEDDDVYYLIDWGDGTTSGWIGPYPSGQIVEISHEWSEPGVYYIRAKARDIHGDESDWSDPYEVVIGNEPPNAPTITGQISGKAGTEYEYTFNAEDPDSDDVRYFINWGDNNTEWTGYNLSGTDVKVKHKWSNDGTYNITAKAQDIHGALGPEGTLTVNIPRNKPFNFNFNLLSWLFDQFPLLEVFLRAMNLLR